MKNRIRQYIFCIVFMGLGAFILYYALKEYFNGSGSENWPTVEAKVIESKVDNSRNPKAGSQIKHTPKVTYTYVVNNITYRNDRIRFGSMAKKTYRAAESFTEAYPEGSTIRIFYKETDPALSVIRPGISDTTYAFLAAGGTFFLFGFLALFIDLEKEKERTRQKMEEMRQKEEARKKE